MHRKDRIKLGKNSEKIEEMSTIFIAVQCYQCSTMQVKQQRRSGNKWSCAVCNEKQSVQKVFARASMAKDVRKFVQSFNMSRKYADEQAKIDEIDGEILDEDQIECSAKKERRSDWNEYLDLDEDRSQIGGENKRGLGSDFAEVKIVTEFPEVKNKRSGSTSRSSWSEDGEGDGLYRPVFSKRKHVAKNSSFQDEIRNWESPSAIDASKWSNENISTKRQHIAKNFKSKDGIRKWKSPLAIDASKGSKEDDGNARTKTSILAKVRGPSKWSEYITEEENFGAKNGESLSTEQGINIFETMLNDDRVEDDVHPDFK